MENKVGLYRMLIDASCAISQNLGELTPFLGVDSLKSARKSLREITACARLALGDVYVDILSDKE